MLCSYYFMSVMSEVIFFQVCFQMSCQKPAYIWYVRYTYNPFLLFLLLFDAPVHYIIHS